MWARRQRRQSIKADMFDVLSQEVLQWFPTGPPDMHADFEFVQQELAH